MLELVDFPLAVFDLAVLVPAPACFELELDEVVLPVLVPHPDPPPDMPCSMQSWIRSMISWLRSPQFRARTFESVWLPEAWQSPLEAERVDADAAAGVDPVFGSAAGAAVFATAGGAALIVGTLDADPWAVPVPVSPPVVDDPAAGICW